MELFIALGFPLILLVGLTLVFMTGGIPSWVQQFNRNSATLWNFGIIAMGTMWNGFETQYHTKYIHIYTRYIVLAPPLAQSKSLRISRLSS